MESEHDQFYSWVAMHQKKALHEKNNNNNKWNQKIIIF